MKLYLDDKRIAPKGFVLVRNVKDAIIYLKTGVVTEISLDHDLGCVNECGYDVLLWIEKQVVFNYFEPPLIRIHTSNPSARKKMELCTQAIYRLYVNKQKYEPKTEFGKKLLELRNEYINEGGELISIEQIKKFLSRL